MCVCVCVCVCVRGSGLDVEIVEWEGGGLRRGGGCKDGWKSGTGCTEDCRRSRWGLGRGAGPMRVRAPVCASVRVVLCCVVLCCVVLCVCVYFNVPARPPPLPAPEHVHLLVVGHVAEHLWGLWGERRGRGKARTELCAGVSCILHGTPRPISESMASGLQRKTEGAQHHWLLSSACALYGLGTPPRAPPPSAPGLVGLGHIPPPPPCNCRLCLCSASLSWA